MRVSRRQKTSVYISIRSCIRQQTSGDVPYKFLCLSVLLSLTRGRKRTGEFTLTNLPVTRARVDVDGIVLRTEHACAAERPSLLRWMWCVWELPCFIFRLNYYFSFPVFYEKRIFISWNRRSPRKRTHKPCSRSAQVWHVNPIFSMLVPRPASVYKRLTRVSSATPKWTLGRKRRVGQQFSGQLRADKTTQTNVTDTTAPGGAPEQTYH